MAYLLGTNAPPVAPEPYTPWIRTQHIFHGWDGSSWDVTDGRGGVFLMPEGIEGMGMPDIQNYTFSSPVVHGLEWEGWRATGRECHWVIGVFEDSSLDWLDVSRRFWRIFQPGKVLRWEVILPNNQTYNLYLRFKADPTSVYSRDPVKLGWAIYGITCFAEQPFWEGEPQEPIWYPATGNGNFYGGTGFGPPFYIKGSSDISSARVTNPGDVDAYVSWELTGPFSTATVGLNGKTVTVGTTSAGVKVILNTDPRELTATRGGTDIMASLGSFEFTPIPPGVNTTLSLSMTGTGSIQAKFTPLYFRSV